MRFQIRVNDLSEWQQEREAEYEEAVRVLRNAGYPAEYVSTVVGNPTEEPGYIHFSKR